MKGTIRRFAGAVTAPDAMCGVVAAVAMAWSDVYVSDAVYAPGNGNRSGYNYSLNGNAVEFSDIYSLFCNAGWPAVGMNWSIGGGDAQYPDRLIAIYANQVAGSSRQLRRTHRSSLLTPTGVTTASKPTSRHQWPTERTFGGRRIRRSPPDGAHRAPPGATYPLPSGEQAEPATP